MSQKSSQTAQSVGAITAQPFLLLAVIGIWAIALLFLGLFSLSSDALPLIAKNGLADVYGFYFPLMVFTLLLLFYLTRKRERPTWQGFAVERATAGREILLVVSYLVATQWLLGRVLNVGLHFPGPDAYTTGSHTLQDVLIWVVLQTLFYIAVPLAWLRHRGFRIVELLKHINFKRDIWIILLFWCGDFFGVVFISDFSSVPTSEYATAIPFGILVNTLGAGLPVLIMIHLIIIPRLSVLLDNQLLVIMLGGFVYALFSMFDPGVSYDNLNNAALSVAYIISTQTLIGMGKAAFTVRTGNPVIHFTSYHILGARVAFDTAMYSTILK